MIKGYNGLPLPKDNPIQSARGGLFDERCREISRQLRVLTEYVAEQAVKRAIEDGMLDPFFVWSGADPKFTKTLPGERIAYP